MTWKLSKTAGYAISLGMLSFVVVAAALAPKLPPKKIVHPAPLPIPVLDEEPVLNLGKVDVVDRRIFLGAGLADIRLSNLSISHSYGAAYASAWITNRNTYDVKDVELSCNVYSNSGTFLRHMARTVYEIVPRSGGTFVVSDLPIGYLPDQGTGFQCVVRDYVRM